MARGFLFLLISLCLFNTSAKAATYYSCNGSNLSVVGSWWANSGTCTGAQPANFTNAADVFIVQAGHTNTFNSTITIAGSLTVNGTATLAANIAVNTTLAIGAGGILNLATFTLGTPTSTTMAMGGAASTISGSGLFTLGGTLTVTDNGGNGFGATISAPMALGANRIITVADDVNDPLTPFADLLISGIVSGGFTLDKQGTGTLALSGANTYTGATTVTAGALNVRHATGLGTTAGGVTVSNGAALEFQGGITIGAEALSITGTGISSNGSLRNISGQNTYGGTVTLAGASTIQSDGGIMILSNGTAITAANQNLVLQGVGTGTLTTAGPLDWVLSGTGSNYTGNTILSATSISPSAVPAVAATGTLRLGAAGVIPNASNVIFSGGRLMTGLTTGFSETAGTVGLTASSTLALGTGVHTLNFSASNGVAWTAATTLTITGWTGAGGSTGTAGKIFFGNAAGTLTGTQLSQIAFAGYGGAPILLATGELVPPTQCMGSACTHTLTSANVADVDASLGPYPPRICMTGATPATAYTHMITNIGGVADVNICVIGYWTPSTAFDNSGANGNLKKLDVTGTLTAPGISLWATTVTNSGYIHVTGAGNGFKMNENNQGSSLTNAASGILTIDDGDLTGPNGGTGFIDNNGTINISSVTSNRLLNYLNFNGTTAFVNGPTGVINVGGDIVLTSNGGNAAIYNYGKINVTETGAGIGRFKSQDETATNSAFYNFGVIVASDFQLNNSALDFYNYCRIKVVKNYAMTSVSAGGMHGPLTGSGYVGRITVGLTSNYGTGVFVPTGEQQEFCDASGGGWDVGAPAAGGWSTCSRSTDGDAICDNLLLPVTLLSFNVGCSENDNSRTYFEWATVAEINNDYFTVENSTDGRSFNEVVRVKGAGNSHQKLLYNAEASINREENIPVYYRLKQTDFDGATSYSNIVKYEGCKKKFNVRVINNGNSDDKNIMVYVNNEEKLNLSMSLFDVTGRLIQSKSSNLTDYNFIEFSNVLSGMYFLEVKSNYDNVVEKIIVR